MKIYSLSHIDLDGFFCQYLISKKYKNYNIEYFNSNYGPEIIYNLKKIIKKANKEDLIYITDLSLSKKEYSCINKYFLEGYNIIVYDHHLNKELKSKNYSWMELDTSISASKIIANKLNVESKILESVDNYDLWRVEEDIFIGSALSELINTNHLFLKNNSQVVFYNNFFKYLENTDLKDISSLFNSFCIKYFKENYDIEFKTLKWALSELYFKEMNIEYFNKKYLYFFDMDREYYHYISYFLLNKDKTKVIVNFQKNGRISMKSRDIDVNDICVNYFNGGGHKGASGGYVGYELKCIEDCINVLRRIN